MELDTGSFNTAPRTVAPASQTGDSERKVIAAGLLADRMVQLNDEGRAGTAAAYRVLLQAK